MQMQEHVGRNPAVSLKTKQRRAAQSLVGKRVHFAHQVGGDVHTVFSATNETDGCGWMVTLDDLPGCFAPHLFVKAGK